MVSKFLCGYALLIPIILFGQKSMVMQLPYPTHFEKDENYTPTYAQIIEYYQFLDHQFKTLRMTETGTTDSGKPLHEIVLSKHGFDPENIRKKNLPVWMINNGIHPGEPCGIDASMLFVRDVLTDPKWKTLLDHMVIVVVPVYNIGGIFNRSGTSRANQAGPKEYGFRGNAKNYDLNRDFIKGDAANTRSFWHLFHQWDPAIFVDTHTSNGADYQYVMTLIASQNDKLGPVGQKFQEDELLPFLYSSMKDKNQEMTPYVHTISRGIPDYGIKAFLDYPRYSSGFAALHHTWSFMPEAHMLKPYRERVYSTLTFLESVAEFIRDNGQKLQLARSVWKKSTREQSVFPLDFVLDTTRVDSFIFHGYEAGHKTSEVTGQQRLYYDRTKPFSKKIKYLEHYHPKLTVIKPKAYVIPQGYKEVITRLQENKVVLTRLEKDTRMAVQKYKIISLKTGKEPYEGHFIHHDVQVKSFAANQLFYAGDYVVFTDQESVRFIVETLEPQAPDGYFAWNFFDAILQQKEYFSPYVFEDTAAKLLREDAVLRRKFEEKKADDTKFAEDAYAQLDFIYRNSPYYEPTHRVYPIARLEE
jgi:hypothetical protein